MASSQSPSESDFRRIVREEMINVGLSLVGTVVGTVISILAALIGIQLIQFGYLAAGPVDIPLITAGGLVVIASLYLLYLLYIK